MANPVPFAPDYATPPGSTLRELLDDRGLGQSDLAVRMGMSEKTVSQIINGVAPLTYETAEKLEMVLGVPARFWNTRELHYRESQSRIEAHAKLESEVAWLKEIPVKELVAEGYADKSDDKATLVHKLLAFFGVSSVDAWRKSWLEPVCQYRGKESQKRKPGYVAAWLRIGELVAEEISCEPFDGKRFREALNAIRSLTTAPASTWISSVVARCAAAGVAFVVVPEIPGAAVSGVAKWLSKDRALIQLSLKYKTDDQFWFSFFHEACHILFHGKRDVFLENGHDTESEEEREANAFARDILIPPHHSSRLPYLKSRATIRAFAGSIGIAPGIVVGRLQHDGLLSPKFCNDLKVKLKWKSPDEESE